jgi:hypothetical protein
MKKATSTKQITFAGLALWFAIVGCALSRTPLNDVMTESQSVSMDSATSANVQIDFPAGELKVQSGASNLMDASFRYNVDDWQPQVDYSENGARGELLLSQPGARETNVGSGLVNEWEIHLGESAPMDLVVRTAAGKCQLDLGGLDLSSLMIETGAGVTNVDLDGAWQHDVNVTIRGGVGEITVNLPAEMGVRVEMETGLATVTANGLIGDENGYVNQAFGTAPYTLNLKLETGMGSVLLVSP